MISRSVAGTLTILFALGIVPSAVPHFLSCATALAFPEGGEQQDARPDLDRVADAGAKFQQNCISCHQPPDLALATDRAWLDQINRTA